jgi:hypothetical protein
MRNTKIADRHVRQDVRYRAPDRLSANLWDVDNVFGISFVNRKTSGHCASFWMQGSTHYLVLCPKIVGPL